MSVSGSSLDLATAVTVEDRVEVYRAARGNCRRVPRRDIELKIQRIQDTQKVAKLGMLLTGLELIHPLSANASLLGEVLLAEAHLKTATADLRGGLADGSHMHARSLTLATDRFHSDDATARCQSLMATARWLPSLAAFR